MLSPQAMRRCDLEELQHKYHTLVMMRRQREALESAGILRFEGEALAQRNAQGQRLARRFPGVLRELDALPSAEMWARAQVLAAHLKEPDDPVRGCAAWIEVVCTFHLGWRRALALKGWLRRQEAKGWGPQELEACRAWWRSRGDDLVHLAPRSVQELQEHWRPPQRRLSLLVWRLVEERTGLGHAAAEHLIFSPHLTGAH